MSIYADKQQRTGFEYARDRCRIRSTGSGIPADAQVSDPIDFDVTQCLPPPSDTGEHDKAPRDVTARFGLSRACLSAGGPGPDVFADKRATARDYLEGFVMAGIMAASYLNSALHIWH